MSSLVRLIYPPWVQGLVHHPVVGTVGRWVALVLAAWLVLRVLFTPIRRRRRNRPPRPLPAPAPIGRRRNPDEGKCIQAIGRLGDGKTSYVVGRATALAVQNRLPIYANAAIRPDATVLRSWSELDALPLCVELGISDCVNGCDASDPEAGCHPAVLILDELHLWYPSSTTLMPKEQQQQAFELLSYARKRGWTVFATTQGPSRIHTGWRNLITENVRCRRIIGRGRFHQASLVDNDKPEKVIFPWYGWFRPRRIRYNTRAEVKPLWKRTGRSEARARPSAPNGLTRPVLLDPAEGPPPFTGHLLDLSLTDK